MSGRVVRKVDREYLRLLLLRQAQQGLNLIEFVDVFALVQQDLAVGVVDDRLLDDGRRDDVVHFLRNDDRLAEILTDGFIEVANILAHIGRGEGFPALFDQNHLTHAFEPPHLADISFHDDDRHDRKQDFVIFDIIQLEDDESFMKQIQLLVRVEQVVVLSAFVVRFEHRQEVVDVEILFPDVFLAQQAAVVPSYESVETVEGGLVFGVSADMLQIEVYGIRQGDFLGTRRRFVVPFPQGQDQRLDALPLLDVEHPVVGIKGIETDRFFVRVGEIDPVPASRLLVDQLAETLVGISHIDDHHMGTLLVILTNYMIEDETLTAARRSETEFIPIRRNALFHRQI